MEANSTCGPTLGRSIESEHEPLARPEFARREGESRQWSGDVSRVTG
jgi:hypothetical protein